MRGNSRGLGLSRSTAKAEVLRGEARRVADRRSHLNDALAWSAARWAADQAIAAGASVIYAEDLRSMEARGTSRSCPRCLSPLRHCKAPDRPAAPGWKWARCPGCGWQGDRDHGAWQRIAARGLAHQAKTTTSRDNGTMAVRAIDDELEARAAVAPYASRRDRSKAGQRPEGHAAPARPPLPRAAHRDQHVTTTSTAPARRPHRARGAAFGAGFHLHAHATPPRREPDPQPIPANPG